MSALEYFFRQLLRLKSDRRGAGVIAGIATIIVAIVVGFYLVSALMPGAILGVDNATTTDWGTSTISLWNVISPIGLLAIILAFVAAAFAVFKMTD